MATTRWSDQKTEDIVGNLLRAGVLISAAIVVLGAILYLARHGLQKADYRYFHGEPKNLVALGGIVQYAFTGRGRGIIQLGLLLLIATPIARVAFSIVAFALERDWMYVAFTSVVLAILCYSLLGF
ncbi:MAG TPA: DUF1634 domain-containing protein [Terriglobales bacterium]|nr:DUF1634 domain-containing protein [Terriglobales bacterium]